MTNPDNIVRVRARTGGRASVYEANGWCQAYTSGLLEGNGVLQNTSADMNVLVGGSASKPDVVLAENPAGYKIALDLVGQQAVAITAPASNSRISAIVAYTDDLSLSTTEDTVTGSPASCGLIVVNGTAASTPSEPTDTQIRSAITADGATGSQAAYCVIATILVANNTTIITNSEITNKIAGITAKNVDFTTFSGDSSTFEISNTVSCGSTKKEFGSVTISSPGLYFFHLFINGGSSGTTKMRTSGTIRINGINKVTAAAWSIPNYAGNNFAEEYSSGIYWLDKNDIVSLWCSNDNWTGNIAAKAQIIKIY